MNDEQKGMVLYDRASTGVTIPDATNLRALATDLLNSGLYPHIKGATQAIAVIATGQEIGLGPTASLTYIAPINGRMTMESKVMLALFQRSGGKTEILERSKTAARVKFMKAGREPYVSEYTEAMAKTEQLWGKPTWTKMPETMLFWRAISNGIKAYDPGVIMGIALSTEEAEDYPNGLRDDEPTKAPAAEKEAKRGPGRPRKAEPAPAAAPEPEKPATAQPEAPPARSTPDQPAQEAEVVGFEPPKAEPEKHEAEDPEEITIAAIKQGLKDQGVDERSFKEWLFEHQAIMSRVKGGPKGRQFLVKMKNAIRWHGGDPEDHEYLLTGLASAVAMFRYAKQTPEPEKK